METCYTLLIVTWIKLQEDLHWLEKYLLKEVLFNIEQAANVLDKDVSEVKIVALDRERHADAQIREVGAELHLMGDGDVSGAIWAARPDGPYDMLMGIGAIRKFQPQQLEA